MRKYLNYGKHKVGLVVGAMVMSVVFGCAFARGVGAISYSISYIENVATSMPENELSGLTGAGASTTTLSPTSPAWVGHKFLGWCDQATTKSGDTDTCATGHDHQPGGTLTLDATGANNVKLYAMWEEEKTITNSTNMQEVTSCPDTIPLETVYTLTDPRDNQTYKVARLKDGKCWMVENLNLAGGTALSADDTDVTSAYISSFSTSNNLTKTGDTIVLPASSTSGFNTANYSYVYNSGNKTNCGASGQNTPCYSYYSWDAATLGSGRTIATDNTDAEQSICPKGWRLPTSGATSNNGWKRGDFYALATAYGANLESKYYDDSSATGANFYNNAGPGTVPGFPLAGNYSYGSFYGGGSDGYYWSSTSSYDSPIARYLLFVSSDVYSARIDNRYFGFSVRCLFSGQ